MFVSPAFAQEAETPVEPDAEAPAEPVIDSEPIVETQTNTEVGVEHDAGASFPPFDTSTYPSQLLWLALTFGLFYLFLKKVVVPRIGGILDVREGRIAQDLDQAAKLKEEADAAVAAYEQELAEARAKANSIGQEARDNAKNEAEAERKKVETALEAKLSDAEARIALIKDAAMRDVGQIAEETAGAIVQELIGAKPDKASLSAAVKTAQK